MAAAAKITPRPELQGYTVEELRALVQEGIDSGPAVDGEEAFARIRSRVRLLHSERT